MSGATIAVFLLRYANKSYNTVELLWSAVVVIVLYIVAVVLARVEHARKDN